MSLNALVNLMYYSCRLVGTFSMCACCSWYLGDLSNTENREVTLISHLMPSTFPLSMNTDFSKLVCFLFNHFLRKDFKLSFANNIFE
jgi:hypothetical protein